MDIRYLTPQNMKKVFNDVSNELMDIFDKSDRELTFDALKYDKEHSTDWLELKSSEPEQMENVYAQDIRLIAVLFAQLILFRRIVRQNWVDDRDMGFPTGFIPLAFKFTESWEKSSGKQIKKMMKLKEGFEEVKLLTTKSWMKYFKVHKVYESLSKQGKHKLKRLFN